RPNLGYAASQRIVRRWRPRDHICCLHRRPRRGLRSLARVSNHLPHSVSSVKGVPPRLRQSKPGDRLDWMVYCTVVIVPNVRKVGILEKPEQRFAPFDLVKVAEALAQP